MDEARASVAAATASQVGNKPAHFAAAMAQLQTRLGYTFAQPALLAQALTHSTWANEQRPIGSSYERLEFLGDAVLQLVVSDHLLIAMPAANEGTLSRRRSEWVREPTLATVAQALDVGPCIRMGVGSRQAPVPQSVLADVVEAVLAAIYLDCSGKGGTEHGLRVTRAIVLPQLVAALAAAPAVGDSKTQLQELCHSLGLAQPMYRVASTTGPAHARRYHIELEVTGYAPVQATASSKRVAEQACAQQMLQALPPP